MDPMSLPENRSYVAGLYLVYLRVVLILPYSLSIPFKDEGVAQPSMSTELLRDAKLCLGSERELAIKWATASAYLAGADTVSVVFSLVSVFP